MKNKLNSKLGTTMLFKKLLLSLVVITSFSKAAESEFVQPVKFAVMNSDGQMQEVQRCFVDPLIRNIPACKLEQALPHLAIRICQLDNGEYIVRAHVKGLGGGRENSFIAYWTTKIVVLGGYAVIVWFQPNAAAEVRCVLESIEIVSMAAFVATLALSTE